MDSPLLKKIFNLHTSPEFDQISLEIFRYQAENNLIYKSYLKNLDVDVKAINHIHEIPFLPIEFFKSSPILTREGNIEKEFVSSGTTGNHKSHHFLYDTSIYKKSFTLGFESFYGNLKEYCILALLPGYLEQENSSLVFMVDTLIRKTEHPDSGFHLDNFRKLGDLLSKLEKTKQKTILFGVSFALMDFAEYYDSQLQNTIVMETGGMKGRKKEITREELHHYLCTRFGVKNIHSEYGMTELLSQAYSKGDGLFNSPPWMKILIRDAYDPFHYLLQEKTGGINIIDLANIHSLSFIETQDLGRLTKDGGFEVFGRFDHSDIRGCNLLLQS